MAKRTDINKILVIGSGPIVIGQGAEFDYAGTQACLALKEEGYEVVLCNSNPATIMTDLTVADKVYMEPLTLEYVAKIVRHERPDAIVPGIGGQTGLNLAMQLEKKGVLKECQVELLGTCSESIERAEDREQFKNLCEELGEPVLPSVIANTMDEAVRAAEKIGYPVVLRPAFTLGGTGGGFADDEKEFTELIKNAIALSPVHQVLIEKSIKGFKEIEYEVIRDANDTAITVCNMENIDPKPRRPRPERPAPARANNPRRGYLSKLDDMRRRYPVAAHIIYIALAILCLVIILSFGLDWGTRHGKSIVVPNFVGMDISEAEREAERMDLRIVVQDSIFDSDVAGGVVVEQLPRHGDKRSVEVKPGRKIYLTINAYNRRMVTVPYVAKQSLRQAKNQLERAGLTIRELIYEPDMVATDYVLREEINGRQIMATSTPVSVPYGTGVTLYVSYQSGRASRVVPKLIGMRLSQAQSTLWDNGLNVGKIEYDASVKDFKDRREAKVYKQSLHQNQGARPGARVSLWLTVDGESVNKHAKASEAEALRYEQQRRREDQELADSIARAKTVESLMKELSNQPAE